MLGFDRSSYSYFTAEHTSELLVNSVALITTFRQNVNVNVNVDVIVNQNNWLMWLTMVIIAYYIFQFGDTVLEIIAKT